MADLGLFLLVFFSPHRNDHLTHGLSSVSRTRRTPGAGGLGGGSGRGAGKQAFFVHVSDGG